MYHANVEQDLVEHLRANLPVLPDRVVDVLVSRYGLSVKDAGTLLSFDNGDRLEYFFEVTNELARARGVRPSNDDFAALGKASGNWYVGATQLRSLVLTPPRVLMELGSLFKDEEWSSSRVPPSVLVSIISHLLDRQITSRSAKRLLSMKFDGDQRHVQRLIEDHNMTLRPLSSQEYRFLAQTLVDEKPDMVRDIVEKGQEKKIKWFVGQMMARSPEGTVEAGVAEEVVWELVRERKEKGESMKEGK
jgi:aspartyl-tRNA(Asn)/glutamyl-tRNA(Gln) amidotransferase subunit B